MADSSSSPAPCAFITGATGFLGRQVVAAFGRAGWSTVNTGFARADPPRIYRLDLNDEDAIAQRLDEKLPNIVIHCAASRFPDVVAADPSAARALNVATTETLGRLCLKRSLPLLYISTDYVFPGRPGEAPYHSSSPTDPPNLYGQTKRDGEIAVLSTLDAAGLGIVLRVPVLYGAVEESVGNKESAVNVLLDTVWAAQEPGQEIKVDDWAIRYPTNTEDVARVVVDISKNWVSAAGKVLQFSAEERMTKYGICEVLAGLLGLGMGGLKRDTSGSGGAISRPYDTKLDTQALKDLGIETRAMGFEAWWKWQVRAYRK